ncbi:MAG: hypothetical protein JXA97_12500 [Anaerolineales bacterium]|nr:hypothetical protein [Anaerolineales bacterium]
MKRSFFIRLIGGAVLVVGLVAAIFGPLEMYCFYLFSEGGVFHYEGFRFGSFMFGSLAAQIMGYYFIAAVLIPFGFGTLTLKRWARHLGLALVQFWMIGGLPLIAAFFVVLVGSKELAWPFLLLVGILLAASYLALPWLAVRFYNHPGTILSFSASGAKLSWLESIPIPVLGLGFVDFLFILILHAQIFFNGIFPLIVSWITGLDGILLIDAAIISLVALLWGLLTRKLWAWWGTLIYFSLMTVSYLTTLATSSWQELLQTLRLQAFEMGFLEVIPIHGSHIAILAGIPFVLIFMQLYRVRNLMQFKIAEGDSDG